MKKRNKNVDYKDILIQLSVNLDSIISNNEIVVGGLWKNNGQKCDFNTWEGRKILIKLIRAYSKTLSR